MYCPFFCFLSRNGPSPDAGTVGALLPEPARQKATACSRNQLLIKNPELNDPGFFY
jgi:hypothetical protein